MADLPIIWSAVVMKDDAACIKFLRDQCPPKPAAGPMGLALQLDMTRKDMAALRDVLTAALDR